MTGNRSKVQVPNIFARAFGFLTQSVTAAAATPPQGSALAALAIKADTLQYPFDSSKDDVDLIQGTISACLSVRALERGVLRFKAADQRVQHLLDNPNPVQTRVDFLEECSQFYDVTGTAMIYFIPGDGGFPAEMWCLPSYMWVAIFDDPSDPIPTAYRAADGRVIADVKRLLIIRQNSVKSSPYIGRGYLGEHRADAILYDTIIRSQQNYFDKGGAPNVAIEFPTGIMFTTEQVADMQKIWNQKYGQQQQSNIAIIPDGGKVTDFGPREINYVTSRQELRDSIREAFQVPKILLGDTDNVNYNNGQTAMAMFERTVVLRWAQKMAISFTNFFGSDVAVDPHTQRDFTIEPTEAGPEPTVAEYQFAKEK